MKENPLSIYVRLLDAQGGACFHCRDSLKFADATRDHLVPRSRKGVDRNRARGGSKWQHTIVLACNRCNRARGRKLPLRSEILRARDIWRRCYEAKAPPKRVPG